LCMYEGEQHWRKKKYTCKIIEDPLREDIEQFHFEGDTIITCSYDGVLKIFNMQTCVCTHTIEHTSGEIVWFDFHMGVIASSHMELEVVNLWDMKTGKNVRKLNSPSWVNTFCFKGDRHLVCGEEGFVRVWDIEYGKILQTLETPNEVNIDIWSSENIILCESGLSIRAFDSRTFQCVHSVKYNVNWPYFLWYEWDPRAPIIYTPSESVPGDIEMWDVNSKKQRASFHGHTKKVTALYLEGHKLVSSSYDNTLRVWDVNNVGSKCAEGGECVEKVESLYEIESMAWGVETEDKNMVGLCSEQEVCIWQF